MEYTTLGGTGLRVSVAGLGCGGPSRLGVRDNNTEWQCVTLVRQALDLGVNFLDTAEVYGTEEIVGKAVAAFTRDKVVISTKKKFPLDNPNDPEGEVRKSLEQSLRFLRTDYIDVYQAHGVEPAEYEYAETKLLPVLEKMREEGKIRFIGISEAFVDDMSHRMLRRAIDENPWDVVMTGFNMLNQSARAEVLVRAQQKNIGTLVMFAVRRALSQPKRLKDVVAELRKKGLIASDACNPDAPLDFLLDNGNASTVVDAAYRFCRYQPGVHVVLTGTGNPDHLKENLKSLAKPPLPEATTEKLKQIFAKVDCVTGN